VHRYDRAPPSATLDVIFYHHRLLLLVKGCFVVLMVIVNSAGNLDSYQSYVELSV